MGLPNVIELVGEAGQVLSFDHLGDLGALASALAECMLIVYRGHVVAEAVMHLAHSRRPSERLPVLLLVLWCLGPLLHVSVEMDVLAHTVVHRVLRSVWGQASRLDPRVRVAAHATTLHSAGSEHSNSLA